MLYDIENRFSSSLRLGGLSIGLQVKNSHS